MRIEKEKIFVGVYCVDGTLVKGFMHVDPGLRVLDFMNNHQNGFLALTNAEFFSFKDVRSFKLLNKSVFKKNAVILNKSAIKFIEEL